MNYSEKQLYRLKLIAHHLERLNKFIDWKAYSKDQGPNVSNHVKRLFLEFLEQKHFDDKPQEEKTDLDMFLEKDL